jgi:hypothetical protein
MKALKLARAGTLGLLAIALALGFPAARAGKKAPPQKPSTTRAGRYRLSGPYRHKNLTLFLIHGKDWFKGRQFLSLEEGLRRKKVTVYETGEVNELAMKNLAADADIFVLSGDIVKGGQQDRTIAFDLVLPKRSGKVRVTSYCVEEGRWHKRAGEDDRTFGSSQKGLPSREGKIAVRGTTRAYRGGHIQGGVWKEVARKQQLLAKALGKSVRSCKSKTSLQLTLEDRRLLKAVAAYTNKFSPLLKGKKDVVGYAFAINGALNSADIYASPRLFRKLWPKLLNATVVEAIAEGKADRKVRPVRAAAVRAFLAEAERGKPSTRDVTRRIRLVTKETKKNVLFVTRDRGQRGIAMRKNYLAKSNLPVLDLSTPEPSRNKGKSSGGKKKK